MRAVTSGVGVAGSAREETWDGWPLIGVVVAALPLVLLVVVLARPALDGRWENDPAHFWLVLAAAGVSVALGYAISVAARRRRDARLFLVSLAFIAAAAFLGLHALATPQVLLDGKNAGFELATPIGLVLAGLFAAASGLEFSADGSVRAMRLAPALYGLLLAVVVLWGIVSLAELGPLADPLGAEELNGWQVALAATGMVLYGLAAFGYFRLYRRRGGDFLLAVTLAFVLLAEAMIVIAWARNWHVSWWEWHLVMLGAFVAIGLSARSQWHEERFSALYLERTLAGARDVSILFADLQGFTSFSERTSPGEVAAMLNAYFERLVPLLEQTGGEVHQLIGDAIMVVFNKEGDQPDHALRAARAGLVLQSAATEIGQGHDQWPRFRVGINSGEAHTGVVGATRGHRKHGVIGDTVNLAARLEGRAPVGRVVVGAETAQRLPDGAVLERLPELHVKGKEAPVEAYVLHSL
jgi:class 3 adenylate cyclase